MQNLKVITPKNFKVTLLHEGFIPKEGATLKMKVVQFFFPTLWEIQIDKLEAPNLMIDVAMKSPFKTWKHYHIYSRKSYGVCELKDRIEYSLPFYLGFARPIVNFFINNMFEYRHMITKKHLEHNYIP